MEHGHASFGAQRAQLVFELARLVHDLVDEGLDDRLAEGSELAAAEPAEKALHTREADTLDFNCLLLEDFHARRAQDFANLVRLAALVVMVAENTDHGDRARLDIVGENLSLFGFAEIRQVPAQHQHVGLGRDLREDIAIGRDAVLLHVEVADCRHAEFAVLTRHIALRDCLRLRKSPIARRRRHSRAAKRCGRGRPSCQGPSRPTGRAAVRAARPSATAERRCARSDKRSGS